MFQDSAISQRTTSSGAAIDRRSWVRAWTTVAANSFGGPAGQIAVMHDELVVRRRWVGERRFLHALNYCMLLPGPEAQQLATYLGWLLRGPSGGLFAGAVFILPGFLSIMALSVLFAAYGEVTWVAGLFFGIQAAVLAVVADAVRRIGRRVVTNRGMLGVAVAAFVAVSLFELPFPLVVGAAILVGLVGGRCRPVMFTVVRSHDEEGASNDDDVLVGDDDKALAAPSASRALRVAAVGLTVWWGPVAVLLLTLGPDSVFVDVATFFSSAAVLTFGGAYSVLAYISSEAVTTYGWLQPLDMVSGLGMAETTPGPLIQVVQFVGFMGAYRDPGQLTALQAGAAGAVVATWVTFVPSFLWIFLGAPFIEQLRGRASLTAALSSVTAAVVGVILDLALWFAVLALFGEATEHRAAGMVLLVPELRSLDVAAFAITALSAVAIFRYRTPTLRVVAGAAALGIVRQLLL